MTHHRQGHSLIVPIVCLLAGVLTANPGKADRPGATEELYGNYHFLLEISGTTLAGFQSVSGLSAELEVVEFREGGDNPLIRKIPGRLMYSNITLKRGYVGDDVLHDWIQTSLHPEGTVERRDGTLILQDRAGNEIVRYRFFDGWPCKWKGPAPGGDGSGSLLEEVVICIDWFEED